MNSGTGTIQQQINMALTHHSEDGPLVRELAQIAEEPDFSRFAAHWAPALYERNAIFFENFLVRHLDSFRHHTIIEKLLLQAEADGHDSLFQGLYRKVVNEERWNAELYTLTNSSESDDMMLRAVRRRTFRGMWFGLSEKTALAIYHRNPDLFGSIVSDHVRRRWRRRGSEDFASLRQAAMDRGDGAFALTIFRTIADETMWATEIRHLLRLNLPSKQIVSALQDRHPTNVWQFDADVLIELVRHYGSAVLPYLEQGSFYNIEGNWQTLLDAVRKTGNEAAYWRIFLRIGHPDAWNKALRVLLVSPIDDATLQTTLQHCIPTSENMRWRLDNDTALQLYERLPDTANPLLERFVYESNCELWSAAESRNDEELLNFLSFRAIEHCNRLAWHESLSSDNQPTYGYGQKDLRQIEALSKLVVARFDRLVTESPALYVRHAAATLSYIEPHQIWNFKRSRRHNPIIVAVATQHYTAWLASPEAICELLESPSIFVQLLGLEFLSQGGKDAAQRIVENIRVLRALLFGHALISTKKLVLICLEQAAQQNQATAAVVLPLLAEAIDVRGKCAVDMQAMVSMVRLQHALVEG
ncbi:MAG: hypothetical protein AAGF95_21495 [Chloroflexota bacterium]